MITLVPKESFYPDWNGLVLFVTQNKVRFGLLVVAGSAIVGRLPWEAYAEMLLKRYKNNHRAHFGWSANEGRAWIIGQRLLQSFLNQWRIPYIHDEPVFKFMSERLIADFVIPNFGTVEIKTRPWSTDTMIIQRASWDHYVKEEKIPDYVIALRLKPQENEAQIMGYEHGIEINKLSNAPHICIYSPCYSKPYSELHDFRELDEALKSCSLEPQLCNVIEIE